MASVAAFATAALPWPRISGPKARQKSMCSWPSTSRIIAPAPPVMKRGVPPTPLKARTGECTPPGDTRFERVKSESDWLMSGQPFARMARAVADDHRGAGAHETGPCFAVCAHAIGQACFGHQFDAGIFAAHFVHGPG